ncbi:uncharacterized protein LOC111700698 [Eurytemora carolleeae]|uniref:uncharacterized protein LOC111700698 n=1 Tax=Eurytemora carolleeae TaxID=1294199 RepID=UPI000C77F56B|nr:uncharacterized protein LOC111700698 [Eurytemora carolleeae]|eukprot:XP_023327471.1 uncharacterized protein LOC111700698 [Eurytemora affinis]
MPPNVRGEGVPVRRNFYARDQYVVPNIFHKERKNLSFLYWNMENGFMTNIQDVNSMVDQYSPSILVLGNTDFSDQHNDELRSINGYIGYHLLQEEDSLHQGQIYLKII